jgi:hypothetical protein
MVILAEVFLVGLMLLSRYVYGISRLSLNNEIAGFKFAVVGVFLCRDAGLRRRRRLGGL